MTLPLAHHSALVALPVFAPALVVILVLLVHRLREGRRWEEEEAAEANRETAKGHSEDAFSRSRGVGSG